MKILGIDLSLGRTQNVNKPTPEQARAKRLIAEKAVLRTSQDIKKWRDAIAQAENLENPNRRNLLALYADIMLDAHVTSIIKSRNNKTTSKPFKIVNEAGEEIPDKTLLLDKNWFYDFIELCLEANYYGFSLIQLGDILEDAFQWIEVIPRAHVKPEFSLIVKEPSDAVGHNFREEPWFSWLIPVGSERDLGLLAKAAPLYIWKKNAFGAWSEYQELFGMPMRIGRTNVQDEAMRSNMSEMLENMGRAAWGVFDAEDKVELIQASGSIGNPVYETMIRLCDEQLSKLFFGQTMTSDSGSSRSQAEVHENTADDYSGADMRRIEFIVNDKLFPAMTRLGINMKGIRFKFDNTESISTKDQFTIDSKLLDYYDIEEAYITEKYGTPVSKKAAPVPPDPGSGLDPEKVKQTSNLISNIYKRVSGIYE